MFNEPAVRRLLTIPTSVYDRIPGSKSVFVTEAVIEKLDKDRFRRDLGNVEEAYNEVFKRLGL